MDPQVKLFYTATVCISAVTIIFAPFGLIFSSSTLKTVHFNLRFLIFTLGILWCVLPVGGILYFLILDAKVSTPELYQKFEYQIAKNICAISGYGFRVIETSICFERLMATVFFEDYEIRKIFRIYSIFAASVSIFITSSFSFLFNIFQLSATVVYVFLFVVEIVNFILLHILKKQNRKLRQKSNSNRALLCSKYQLIENIKSLNLLYPQAIISFTISNTALIAAILIRAYSVEGLAVPVFYSLYNINVIIMSCYWVVRSQWFQGKTNKFKRCFSVRLGNGNKVEVLKVTHVKTALGLEVNETQNVEHHFNTLKNDWK